LSLYFSGFVSPQDTPNASAQRALLALNASDGSLRWTYQAKGQVQFHPVLDHNMVYIGTADGNVDALDAASGKLRWKQFIGSGSPVVSVVTEGSVYGTRSPTPEYVPFGVPADGAVFALNTSDGTSRWTTSVTGAVLGVVDGVVYVGNAEQHTLFALRASDGAQQWQFHASYPPEQIAVAEGQIFLLAADRTNSPVVASFTALNESSGAPQWSYSTQKAPGDIHLVGEEAGVVYLLTSVAQNESSLTSLVALDVRAGTLRWQTSPSPALSARLESGVVYLGETNGIFEARAAADGSLRWRIQTSGKDVGAPLLVADGLLYTSSGGLTALSTTDGMVAWSYPSDVFVQVLAAMEGVLYAVTNATLTGQPGEDDVLAFQSRDGSALWRYDAGYAQIFPVVG
jgi:serine/threonine-protein kinase